VLPPADLYCFKRFKNFFRHLPFVLSIACCLLLFIVALASLQTHWYERMTKGEGIDIILCIDVMAACSSKDFLPNRLEAAKDCRQTIYS